MRWAPFSLQVCWPFAYMQLRKSFTDVFVLPFAGYVPSGDLNGLPGGTFSPHSLAMLLKSAFSSERSHHGVYKWLRVTELE